MSRRVAVKALLGMLQRPALHAQTLGFTHPITGERLQFSSELPEDFQFVLRELRRLHIP